MISTADARLSEYTSTLLTYSVNVAQESRDTLGKIAHSTQSICTESDLERLRFLAFRTEHLRDVGRVEDGRILCTALWGILPAAQPLPPPNREQRDGDFLWANAEDIGGYGIKVDMVVRDTAIVFTAPIAFQIYERPASDLSALVLTRDGQHVYRRFGDTKPLAEGDATQTEWFHLSPQRILSRCSNDLDICVVAGASNADLLGQPIVPLLAATGMGALSGGAFGWAALWYRRRRLSLSQQVKRALADGSLSVVYQPIVRMRDKHVVGVEALARLSDEAGEPISPEVFIKAAEDAGLVCEVARLVIRRALADMRDELLARRDFDLSINLSVLDVLDAALVPYLNDEIARNGLNPDQIVLEITERSTARREKLVEAMKAFQRSGHRFFIDDFGTGYSNLAYLASLPISGIKMDKMFTQAIGKEAVCSAIVENICAISDRLGLDLIVEGVETEEQAAYILQLRNDAFGQGWLYGKPGRTLPSTGDSRPHC
ncbi:EAL domain-containing protein [Ancylobacter moscoviensis]|nr:EAL domain-containing protein [Ancylobacter moscoviensis]